MKTNYIFKRILPMIFFGLILVGCGGKGGGSDGGGGGSDGGGGGSTDTSFKFTSSATVNIDENQNSAVTLLASQSGDDKNITYTISDGDSADFDINGSTGVVTFKTAPDYETKTSYTFLATAKETSTDIGATLDEANQTVVINIVDILVAISDKTIEVKQGMLLREVFDTTADTTGYSFAIVTPPTKGTATIISDKNFTYQYTDTAGATSDSFVVKATVDGEEKNATITVDIAIDPLFVHQWYLKNTGQSAFSEKNGTTGSDINQDLTIGEGLTGAGVKIAIVDSGLEIAHEDLADNIEPGKSCDFDGESFSTSCQDNDPTSSTTDGDHGTSVAGLIAAVGWNGKGGRGVAPKSSIRGFNLLGGYPYLSYYAYSLGSDPMSADVDIFNQSYGITYTSARSASEFHDGIYWNGVEKLRDGKGAIYVKSTGNGFGKYKDANCSAANDINISCENSNMEPHDTHPANIMVSAINAHDKVSSYTTWGSGVWIGSYGGEFGSNYLQYGESKSTSGPTMITTDQSSCSKGYTNRTYDIGGVSGRKATPFHDTTHAINQNYNQDCNYISTFNGTSSATPILSGVVALILEANPALTWRDVKHILASSAVQVDSSRQAIDYTTGAGNYVAQPGWITNSAGFKFHNAYGFGKVNVDGAIALAKVHTSLPAFIKGDWTSSGTINTAIPDNSATGASDTSSVSVDLTIEAVWLEVDISHTHTGDLGIELISPSGTRSVLFTIKSGFGDSDNLEDMRMLSNAFYGEDSIGDWTIKVVDTGDTDTGVLKSWKIKFFGR